MPTVAMLLIRHDQGRFFECGGANNSDAQS